MGLFDKVKKTTIESRRYEEKLYEVALEEVEAGEVRKGLYAKALSKADGDKEKADGIYLKLRVQSIMDDVESKQINHRENERALKAIQVLESERMIGGRPFKSKFKEGSIAYECDYILAVKGYMLHRQLWADWWISAKSNRESCYHSDDLKKIKEWAINAEDLT